MKFTNAEHRFIKQMAERYEQGGYATSWQVETLDRIAEKMEHHLEDPPCGRCGGGQKWCSRCHP